MHKVKLGRTWYKLAFEGGMWKAMVITTTEAASIDSQLLRHQVTPDQQDALNLLVQHTAAEQFEDAVKN